MPNYRLTTPARFLRWGRSPDTTVVACVGDSLTQGTMSADYVRRLSARPTLAAHQFINAGVNGDLTWDVVRRLDEVIACEPDVVTLLIGINDLLFGSASGLAPTVDFQSSALSAGRHRYLQGVDTILARLSAETVARIAVVDLPVLGGEFSELNGLVREYNAGLSDVVRAHAAALLPLHQAMGKLPPDVTIHTDGLHFAEAAGAVIADLVQGFLLQEG